VDDADERIKCVSMGFTFQAPPGQLEWSLTSGNAVMKFQALEVPILKDALSS
jgi:hypothetical protein